MTAGPEILSCGVTPSHNRVCHTDLIPISSTALLRNRKPDATSGLSQGLSTLQMRPPYETYFHHSNAFF